MTLSDISIKNPVFAWMLMIGLIVFGAISFTGMGISQLPDVDFPVLTVTTSWTGAPPETMESAVADVIEDSVMSVEGIKNVTSQCQEGLSTTTIEFEMNTDINVALQEVQTKIEQASRILPNNLDAPPTITKINPDDNPILWTALTGSGTFRDMVLFVRDHLKDALTTISGVGDVRLGGYVDPNMRIWLNSDKMRQKEISVDDVIGAINNGTILTPSGYMDNGPSETNVRIMSEAQSPADFENLFIPMRSGLSPIWKPIPIGDVGHAEEGVADIRRLSRYKGEPSVGLGIIKQRGSNAVAVADAVKAKVKELATLLPKGMHLGVVIDTTKFIKDSTHELLFTLGLSVILTSIVCYLFLGSFGSAFNVILAIPTSLIGAFTVLYFLGFTINTFTLLALTLSIGIVVDDAIMVLENITRYLEEGMSRVKASIVGAREITGAAVAASLAILAIFAPVIFMKGIIGKFFFQFGVAISVAVILSLLEALTLAPMRCSQFLTKGHDTRLARSMNRLMDWLSTVYHRSLKWCLESKNNHPWWQFWYWWQDRRLLVIGISMAVFFTSFLLLKGVNKEFVPAQDQSQYLMTLYTPLGSSMELTDGVFRKAEKILHDRPEVESYYVAIGGFQGGLVNQGIMFIVLKDPTDRPIAAPFTHRPSQQEFMNWSRDQFAKIPGVTRASGLDLSLAGFTAQRGYPITFSVQGPEWDKLAQYGTQIMDRMKGSGLMTDVDTDYNPDMPEVRVIPDREKAAKRGVTVQSIANDISALVGSLQVAKYTDISGHRDDIRIKLLDSQNKDEHDISKIWVRNVYGEMVPLSDVVKMEKKSALLTIGRYNRERAIAIFANVTPGKSQQVAMDYVVKTAKEILPQGYHIVLSGNSQEMKESFESLMMALLLGIFVAYMVLGAQFNSFIHPFTVLLALPFSFTGAFLALRVTGASLNIYSMIGMLLLMGIVKKNSILLVDFTNQRRAAGLGVRDALLEACPLRLRPILMTSVACVAAAIPSAMAFGAGGETVRPMSIVVIGGVILSTLLTLVVVPCAYSLLAKLEGTRHRHDLDAALRSIEEDDLRAKAQRKLSFSAGHEAPPIQAH